MNLYIIEINNPIQRSKLKKKFIIYLTVNFFFFITIISTTGTTMICDKFNCKCNLYVVINSVKKQGRGKLILATPQFEDTFIIFK